MAIRAVVFDIGGILELTPPTGWPARWTECLGAPNVELIDYFRGLRPRYRTALLSNVHELASETNRQSRRRPGEERQRYDFEALTDLIVYSPRRRPVQTGSAHLRVDL